jgi:hypothetical protein
MKRKEARGLEETRKRRVENWNKHLAIGLKVDSINRGKGKADGKGSGGWGKKGEGIGQNSKGF